MAKNPKVKPPVAPVYSCVAQSIAQVTQGHQGTDSDGPCHVREVAVSVMSDGLLHLDGISRNSGRLLSGGLRIDKKAARALGEILLELTADAQA